jgi:hypothetical protein
MRTNVHGLAVSTLALLLCAGSGGLLAQDTVDPVLGTWKLNAAKSKFSPGPPAKDVAVTFEAAGSSLKVVADLTDAEGTVTHTEYTASYDGKDYPITGSPVSDTVALTKLNPRSSVRTDKKGGKIVGIYNRTVSSDGKTLTVVQKGTDPKGRKVSNTMVLDKQ